MLKRNRFLFIMKKRLFNQLRLFISQSSILVGGQAVMEGVMMRVPGGYATAVRDPEGNIQIDRHNFKSKTELYPYLKLPLLRGIIGLFESLKIGYSTLNWSAEISFPEEGFGEKPSRLADVLLTIFSFAIAISLFFIAPIGLTSWLFNKDQDAFIFNVISGVFRVLFFITYLLLISFMKDVRRLFQYHGAEHKTVYNFESGEKLDINTAQQFPTQHPRCGTSFVFIIMIIGIITFSGIDSLFIHYVGSLELWVRIIMHILFIPLVAGFGYEILKLTAKYQNNLIFKIFHPFLDITNFLSQKSIRLLEYQMAKPATIQIKLVSSAETGFYYVTKKNPRTKPEKLELKKYDPRIRKHVVFKEAKIK